MSLTRGIHLFNKVGTSFRKPFSGQMVQPSRNSGGLYSYRRNAYPPHKGYVIAANAMMGFTWWWILWHLWHEPGHIIGEWPYPDTAKWTNEELGIPPDDAD